MASCHLRRYPGGPFSPTAELFLSTKAPTTYGDQTRRFCRSDDKLLVWQEIAPPMKARAIFKTCTLFEVTSTHCLSKSEVLQPGVNLSRSTTFRRITGDVVKNSFLVATRTFIRRLNRGDGIPAIAATPIRQIALRADIPRELP
jgi:hypothetical protein